MNQEYRERVKRHLEAGGDPKYVNVKRKADARHESSPARTKALEKKMKPGIHKVGENPSRFVHKGRKGDVDLYETWKGGKQKIERTR